MNSEARETETIERQTPSVVSSVQDSRRLEQSKRRGIRGFAGLLTVAIGCLMFIGGLAGWFTVRAELVEENITVAEDAAHFAGKQVAGPLTAYAQADIVKHHLLEATDGKAYADLGEKDPNREMALNAATVRSALMVSTLAFGVSALAAGAGVTFMVIGAALVARPSRG